MPPAKLLCPRRSFFFLRRWIIFRSMTLLDLLMTLEQLMPEGESPFFSHWKSKAFSQRKKSIPLGLHSSFLQWTNNLILPMAHAYVGNIFSLHGSTKYGFHHNHNLDFATRFASTTRTFATRFASTTRTSETKFARVLSSNYLNEIQSYSWKHQSFLSRLTKSVNKTPPGMLSETIVLVKTQPKWAFPCWKLQLSLQNT